MSKWLLDRLFEAGDQAEPRFAFQGTVNWMRALAEVVNGGACADDKLNDLYARVQRRPVNREADTLVFEGNDSNLLIVFYVQIMPDDFVMQ
ncbi:hypothetical protein ACUNNT_004890, partial [Escherichia coli]